MLQSLAALSAVGAVDAKELAIAVAEIQHQRFNPEAARALLEPYTGMYQKLFSRAESSSVHLRRTMEVSFPRHLALSAEGGEALDYGVKSWDEQDEPSAPPLAFPYQSFPRVAGLWDNEKALKVLDLETGECVRTLQASFGDVKAVVFSPDLRVGLSSTHKGSLKLWNLEAGTCLRTLEAHQSGVLSIALTLDGHRGLSAGSDFDLKLWDLKTGTCLRTLKGDSCPVRSVALTPDCRFALSGSLDGTVKLWDLTSATCLANLVGHSSYVNSVALTPDGSLGLSGGGDCLVHLWDLQTGKCLRSFHGHLNSVSSVALTPDGRVGISGGYDDAAKLWDLKTGQCVRTLEHDGAVLGVAMLPNARFCVSRGRNQVAIWDLNGLVRTPRSFKLCRPSNIVEVASAQATEEAGTSEVAALVAKGEYRAAYEALIPLWQSRGFARDEKLERLYAEIQVEASLQRPLAAQRIFSLRDSIGLSVAVTPDGRVGLSGSAHTRLKLWDMENGRYRQALNGTYPAVLSFDGHRALSACFDGADDGQGLPFSADVEDPGKLLELYMIRKCPRGLRLWDLESEEAIRTHSILLHNPESIALGPDGLCAASVSGDLLLHQPWPNDSFASKFVEEDFFFSKFVKEDSPGSKPFAIRTLTFSRDGRFLLSGSTDKTLKLWEVASGHCLRTFEGHTDHVCSVCLSGDGQYALSGSEDKTLVRICLQNWDNYHWNSRSWQSANRSSMACSPFVVGCQWFTPVAT